MAPAPLDPPSLDEAGRARAVVAPAALEWPALFDSPEAVERAWGELLHAQPQAVRLELERALTFARSRHGDQMRIATRSPYAVHLQRVAMKLASWGEGGTDLLVAALLHDTVEDTHTTHGEIRERFGEDAARVVEWMTAPGNRDQAAVRAYYARLAAGAPEPVRLLKIADRVDNLMSLQALVMRTGSRHRPWARGYLERTGWQVLPLAEGVTSVARVALVAAMADLALFTEP